MMKDEKKTAAVKPAAEKKTPDAKPAAKPAPAKAAKAPAKKPAAKSAAKKSTAKTAAPAAKKAARKPKAITIDTICGLVEKKINKTKAKAIKDTIAVDIEVWGFEDGSNQKMYIEIKDGKATVLPYTYEKFTFRVSLNFANAIAFANDKTTIAKLLEEKDFYAEGNIAAAVKLATIF